jgi:hypothetical protein
LLFLEQDLCCIPCMDAWHGAARGNGPFLTSAPDIRGEVETCRSSRSLSACSAQASPTPARLDANCRQ